MVYSHPWSFNPHINISHYLALRAASECMAHDICVERETQRPKLVTLVSTPHGRDDWLDFARQNFGQQAHRPITEVLVIEQWQKLAKEVLVNQAVRECAKYDRCDSQERTWQYGVVMTDAEIEASWAFWGEYNAKRQCKQHHDCIVAESAETQETYTYHADFEEPAHLRW